MDSESRLAVLGGAIVRRGMIAQLQGFARCRLDACIVGVLGDGGRGGRTGGST
jgi:hypothetical protein